MITQGSFDRRNVELRVVEEGQLMDGETPNDLSMVILAVFRLRKRR
jgi:hypothetical protein